MFSYQVNYTVDPRRDVRVGDVRPAHTTPLPDDGAYRP